MPLCPECNENIDSLKAWFSTRREYTFHLFHGTGIYTGVTNYTEELDDFACPKCGVSLFGTEAAAISFLGGGE